MFRLRFIVMLTLGYAANASSVDSGASSASGSVTDAWGALLFTLTLNSASVSISQTLVGRPRAPSLRISPIFRKAEPLRIRVMTDSSAWFRTVPLISSLPTSCAMVPVMRFCDMSISFGSVSEDGIVCRCENYTLIILLCNT